MIWRPVCLASEAFRVQRPTCQAAVSGYKGAKYQSFKTLQEAQTYIAMHMGSPRSGRSPCLCDVAKAIDAYTSRQRRYPNEQCLAKADHGALNYFHRSTFHLSQQSLFSSVPYQSSKLRAPYHRKVQSVSYYVSAFQQCSSMGTVQAKAWHG